MINHTAYKEEKLHLDEVKEEIQNKEQILKEYVHKLNKAKCEDSSIPNRNVEQNLNLSIKDMKNKELNNILESKNSPYFARMDFQFSGEEEVQKIYIGKNPLNFEKEDLNIVDWRAPLGDIYYRGNLGDCKVVCKDNSGKPFIIGGKKILKRSIDIKNGNISKIQDLEIAMENKQKQIELADKYLIECLKESSDVRLKDIIATIQKDQNNIIREDLSKIVYIQGCAGSGKSTIALHRVAYLIYYYKLNSEDILVVAPNKVFLNYISTTLPELGAENVKQMTYRGLAENILGIALPIEDTLEEEKYLSIKKENNSLKIKGNLVYKELIENYAENLLNTLIPNRDISIYGETIYSHSEIEELFMDKLGAYKLNDRIEKFKEYIHKIAYKKLEEIIKNIELNYENEIELLKKQCGENENLHNEIKSTIEEKENLIIRLNRQLKFILEDYFNKVKPINATSTYIDLINNEKLLLYLNNEKINEDLINEIVSLKDSLTDQDIAPILYLYCLLNNIEKFKYKHIVIDESQDLSPFELATLKELVKSPSFTIVGDSNQSIIPYKEICTKSTVQKIFDFNKNLKLYNLNRSYRSSYEIMLFANEIVKKYIKDKSFIPDPLKRPGDKPYILKRDSYQDLTNEILKQLDTQDEKIKNKVVVFRNTEKCIEFYNSIREKIDCNLIINNTKEYKGGINIMPAYLTKGLEFDLVIVADADNRYYSDTELNRKMLYVQCTRALHKLILIYSKDISGILKNINNDLYEEEENEHDKSIKLKTLKNTILTVIKAKFGNITEDIDNLIKEEDELKVLEEYLIKVSTAENLDNIFN